MVRLLTLVLACLLAVLPASAADYVVPEARLRFPDRLGGFVLESAQRAPAVELGHILQYVRGDLICSVYVYNGGHGRIADGVRNPTVQSEFARAQQDIAMVARLRNWPSPILRGDGLRKNADIEFMTAMYSLDDHQTRRGSLLAITGARGHFVKLRMTGPAEGDLKDLLLCFDSVSSLIAGAPIPDAPMPRPSPPPAAGGRSFSAETMPLPYVLGGFQRQADIPHDGSVPVGAVSFHYSRGETNASIYLYRRGKQPAGDGIVSPDVTTELHERLRDLVVSIGRSLGSGRLRHRHIAPEDARQVSFGTYGGPTMSFLRARVMLSQGDEPDREYPIYLTAWRGYFLRINATHETADADSVRLFMSALVRALPSERRTP